MASTHVHAIDRAIDIVIDPPRRSFMLLFHVQLSRGAILAMSRGGRRILPGIHSAPAAVVGPRRFARGYRDSYSTADDHWRRIGDAGACFNTPASFGGGRVTACGRGCRRDSQQHSSSSPGGAARLSAQGWRRVRIGPRLLARRDLQRRALRL
jgi:hypothetical protein